MTHSSPKTALRASLPHIVLLGLLCSGCADHEVERPGDWVAERDTVGDTVVVRTLSGSVWGQPATLTEELCIGVLDGEDELMFGQIRAMAADDSGGVFVFDAQVPALRYYDERGSYVRTLGGEGSGPGEYRNQTLGLAVRTDGRLVMRDPRNARLNVYDVDGTPWAHWQVASGLYTSQAMVLDTADHVYLKVLMERPERNRPWKIGLLHLDAQGEIVDTIPDPQIVGEPSTAGGTFLPRKAWAWSPLGYAVVGVTGDYSFEIRRVHEPMVRVERSFAAVSVLPDERAAYDARSEWMRHNQPQTLTADIPPVPDTKPAYRGLYVGGRGRIWVHRYTTAVPVETAAEPRPDRPPPLGWREPTLYDVFEPDGTYLGEVSVPERISIDVFRGDTL